MIICFIQISDKFKTISQFKICKHKLYLILIALTFFPLVTSWSPDSINIMPSMYQTNSMLSGRSRCSVSLDHDEEQEN